MSTTKCGFEGRDSMSADGASTTSGGLLSDALVEKLQEIAEGVVSVAAAFTVAAIRIRRGDDLVLVVDTGLPERVGSRIPVEMMVKELGLAEDWGVFKFVPHESGKTISDVDAWVVPSGPVLDAPDAWHPRDMLVAPIYDDDGELRGVLALDEPADGLRPNAECRRVLEGFAAPARRAVLSAVERESFAEQVAMAETVKEIVRTSSAQLNLKGLLAACERSLVEGFRADALWVQTIIDEDSIGWTYTVDDITLDLSPAILEFAARSASYCWFHQLVVTIGEGYPVPSMMQPETHQKILDLLRALSMSSLIFVPLGAGPEHMGSLVLTRRERRWEWSEIERATLLDIGHDLGRATLNARTFERERALVAELRAVDIYKTQLIATVSHELKNPLTAVAGHLEMLEADLLDVSEQTKTSLSAIGRASQRMSRVIEDLLLLRRTADPNLPVSQEGVDVVELVQDAVAMTALVAQGKRLEVEVVTPDTAVLARGERGDLDKVVINLVSNAVKYTPEGRSIRISLEPHADTVVLRVADQGLGISRSDLAFLFTEFFRSTNPEAIEQPGTGLGLAIVQRIVDRHSGTVEVESTLGEGSVFTVTLPAHMAPATPGPVTAAPPDSWLHVATCASPARQ